MELAPLGFSVNNVGYESIAEHLVSVVLRHSNVSSYVEYEICNVQIEDENGIVRERNGCRSKNFLKPDESFVSFQRLYELYTGESLQERIRTISSVQDRIQFVIDFVKKQAGYDCTEYLSKILTLDMLTLNTDRHFNNLGLIINNSDQKCYAAPIFDNGNSLMSDWEKFPDETIQDNLDHVYGQPFSSSLGMQAKYAGFGLELDYEKLYHDLEKEPDSRGLQVLKYQLEHCRSMIRDIREKT